MKILVTGGAGFIGSHLVDAIIASGYEAVIVDHHQKEKERFVNPQAVVYKSAINDPDIEQIFLEEKPDAVCHLAAQISVPISVEDPIYDARINILGSLNLLEAAKKSGVKKIVFAQSGGALYGENDLLPTPELFDSRPISPYGVSKLVLEHYLESYYKLHGIEYIALRFANIYGPRQMLKGGGEGGVIPIFISRFLSGEGVVINGDGKATRDFLFVHDAVDAFQKALASDFVGAANISTGREVSVYELWELLQEMHDKDVPVQFGPERPGDIKRSSLDGNFAKQALGWQPSIAFEEGLRETYNWFKERYE